VGSLRQEIKKQINIVYLNKTWEHVVENINDVWKMPNGARIRTAALNSGLIPVLMWEKPIVPAKGSLAGVSSTAQIPDVTLSKITNVREAILDMCKDLANGTTSDWRKRLHDQWPVLLKLEPSVEIEWLHLHDHVDDELAEIVQTSILNAIPSHGTPDDLPRVCAPILLIKKTPAAMALGGAAFKMVTGVVDLLQAIIGGEGPDSEVVAKYTAFYKLILQKLECFLHATKKDVLPTGKNIR
jgi:hypothetical protein